MLTEADREFWWGVLVAGEFPAIPRWTVPVTRTFSLHDLHEGLELLGTGRVRGKYVVKVED